MVISRGNYLVRVRAQVMIRDDSTGGWVPMGVGGLSNVSVRKRALGSSSLLRDAAPPPPAAPAPPPPAPPPHHHHHHSHYRHQYPHHLHGGTPAPPGRDEHVTSGVVGAAKYEYLIYGKRISDQSVVLSCTIKKDFEYNRVMPTFHHWRTGDKRFGLTFLTAADARAFDKGVRMAVDELLDVWPLLDVWAPKHIGDTPYNLGLAESSPLHKYNSDVGDDEVFMTLNLPVERGDSRSSSDSSSRGGAGCRPPPTPTGPPTEALPSPHPHQIHRIQYMSRHPPSSNDGSNVTDTDSSTLQRRSTSTAEGKHGLISPGGGDGEPGENYSYVRLTPVHEYIYPVVVTEETKRAHRDSTLDRKAISPVDTLPSSRPPLPVKLGRKRERCKGGGGRGSGGGGRARCRHCNEAFSLGDNARGCCEYAPDPVRTGIDAVSCISCAQCMLYHCMADAEGDFARHPCDCGSSGGGGGEGPGGGGDVGGGPGGDGSCGRRWLGLALLSLLVPCLWCYPPLKACHRCGVACGLCGGRHEASPS
ncbi:sprouty-related, EVH1 domain-containing protein 2 isoform X2 [Ischnura elegans]|uniref:sprouty-related, EVH1 domain-containing protein 2 isoform X2 n=1 Tax=Ischnura elegans TaxID=197161 RepID=UPI001ED87B5A|nr:sprouty-related, EVH1 domain-containing protein 2 isoform X2 [Ischnura elegans]